MFSRKQPHKTHKLSSLGQWTIVKQIGSGATSSVYLGVDNTNGKHVAVKIYRRTDAAGLALMNNETTLQQAQKHQHILKLIDFHDSIFFHEPKKGSQKVAASIIDIAEGGNILELLGKLGSFSEKLARTYFRQIISAVEYLHDIEIAHRDIKLENLMLDRNFSIKLADFGCARRTTRGEFTTPVGSSKYYAPEMHMGLAHKGLDQDLFATAVVLFAMVTGHMPFAKASIEDSFYEILAQGKTKRFWDDHQQMIAKQFGDKVKLSVEFKELMEKLLKPKSSERATITEIKNSKWYNGPVYQIDELFKYIRKYI